jgi:hypothetical protein
MVGTGGAGGMVGTGSTEGRCGGTAGIAGGLPPEHRWAARLAGAYLAPVDEQVDRLAPRRWVRWGDEWLVFVPGPPAAEEIRAAVADRLAALGLALSAAKTTLRPAADAVATGRDVAGPPARVWRRGLRDGDVRALRYALPRLDPGPGVSRALPELVRVWPRLLPRAVAYLDRAVHTGEGAAVCRALLEDGTAADPFALGRLLALAGRHEAVAGRVGGALLDSALGSGVRALRELGTRAAALTGRLPLGSEPSPELAGWIARGARAGDSPPRVATLL